MESDLQQQQQQHLHHQHLFHTHQQPPQPNPGLTRFRSAPSSFFATLLDSCEDFLNRPSSPETERILSRLISDSIDDPAPPPVPAPHNPGNFRQSPPPRNEATALRPPLSVSVKSEAEVLQQNNFSSAPCYHQSSPQPPLPNRTPSYAPMKIASANNSSDLIRQSSSPAGFFSSINVDSGFAPMRGSLGAGSVERPLPPAPRFGGHPDPLTRVSSSMAQMTPIAEVGDKRIGENIQEVVDPFGESNGFIAYFALGPWDDDDKNFPHLNASESPNEDARNGLRPPHMLAHHLSLPNTPGEMSAIEKLLQDSVPCKVRAKRGCATHPRSIAERVRRTKISERMRKLQDLVPNMDKQTNTADMLDLAVDHIKDLQQQVKMLSANRAACTCSSWHML